MHLVDPSVGQVGEGSKVGLAGQPFDLEAARLTGRGGTTRPKNLRDRTLCEALSARLQRGGRTDLTGSVALTVKGALLDGFVSLKPQCRIFSVQKIAAP